MILIYLAGPDDLKVYYFKDIEPSVERWLKRVQEMEDFEKLEKFLEKRSPCVGNDGWPRFCSIGITAGMLPILIIERFV